MTKYRNSTIFSSFNNAIRGLFIGIRSQRNIKFAIFISVIVLIAAFMLKFTAIDLALTFTSIVFDVFAELVNTTIEYVIDAYYRNKYSDIARFCKDVAAGTVLIAIVNAFVIGSLLFAPKIVKFINISF